MQNLAETQNHNIIQGEARGDHAIKAYPVGLHMTDA